MTMPTSTHSTTTAPPPAIGSAERITLLAAASLLSAALCAPLVAHADTLYSFVDEHGVMHFSDSPASDTRYRRIAGTPPAATTAGKPQPRPAPAALRPHIEHAARQTGLDPALIQAVAQVESAFNPNAQSPKGALGLMQLMPATAERYGVRKPPRPRHQPHLGGARYLSDLLRLFNDDLKFGAGGLQRRGECRHAIRQPDPALSGDAGVCAEVLARYAVVRGGQ
ncbi:MAG: transglycosylase SLT domain-containing protein [Rhodocyclaceae bacterium]